MKRMKILAALLALILLLSACSAAAISESTGVRTTSGDGAVTSKEALTFPLGNEVPFNGTGYLAPMISNEKVYNFPQTNNVTFEPGARSDWHTHGGMVILVTGGVGYYQEEGKPAQIIRQGDVLEIAPGVKHWHGAAPDSWFSQVVIYDSHYTGGGGESEPVTDEQYASLNAEEYTGRTVKAGNPVMFQRAASASSNSHFSGPVYISDLLGGENAADAPSLHYVVFDPGVINDWHTHEGGQILIATDGVGYHQIEGQPVEVLHPGDVAYCPSGVKHWHGGSADSTFAHIAANTNPERPGVEWFDRISQEEYRQLSAGAFTDVPAGAYYEAAANWCREQGIFSGTLFSPNTAMTRATVANALYRAKGSPAVTPTAFPDIPAGSEYANAVSWTSANGVMSGYADGHFGGTDPVTRQQMAAVLWRYAGSPSAGAGEDFADEASIAAYARTAVDWARANGVINGKEGNRFDPAGTLTRAQTAAILYRYLVPDASGKPDASGTENSVDPAVYMTTDISPEGLLAVYNALNWTPTGKVAVKLSTGEPPASNYLRPQLIKDVVQLVDGTIVECNTAYGGSRASTAMHYQVARDHGFNDIADVVILDENGAMTLPVSGGTNLKDNLVSQHFGQYDSYLVLSHFKGHAMAGYGGAIKNISIGLGSQEGKCLIHTGGKSNTSPWGGDQTAFTESMAEAGKSVSDYLDNGERIVYVNVMNRLSIDCDCDGNPAEPDLHDIGILASTNPVALDQACIDLVYAQKDGNGASLVGRIESRNGLHTLEHAEEIGLGNRSYQLISIDH